MIINLVDTDQDYQYANDAAEANGLAGQPQYYYGNYAAEAGEEPNDAVNEWNADDLPVANEVELQPIQEFNLDDLYFL